MPKKIDKETEHARRINEGAARIFHAMNGIRSNFDELPSATQALYRHIAFEAWDAFTEDLE